MKKKVFWALVFVLLIALTVFTVTKQSASFTTDGFVAYLRAADPRWMIPSIMCALSHIFCEALSLLCISRCLGVRRGLWRGIVFASADIYFSAITPSATGGQPATAYYMTRDRYPGVVTTVTLFINFALYILAILVVSLVATLLSPQTFNAFEPASKVFIIAGTGTQVIGFVGFMLLVFRDGLFMKLVDLFYRIMGKLRIFKNPEKRREKITAFQNGYRECANQLKRNKRYLVAGFFLTVTQRASLMMIPAFVYMAAGGVGAMVPQAVTAQAFVVLGSNCIPIPGAVGVADYLFMDGFQSIVADPVNLELLSRCISFYGCVLLCALIVLIAAITDRIKKKRQGAENSIQNSIQNEE